MTQPIVNYQKQMLDSYASGRQRGLDRRKKQILDSATKEVPTEDTFATRKKVDKQKYADTLATDPYLMEEGMALKAKIVAAEMSKIAQREAQIKLMDNEMDFAIKGMKQAADYLMATGNSEKATAMAKIANPDIISVEMQADKIFFKDKNYPEGRAVDREELDEMFISEENERKLEIGWAQIEVAEDKLKLDKRKVIVPDASNNERDAADNLLDLSDKANALPAKQRKAFSDMIAVRAKAMQRAAGLNQEALDYDTALKIAYEENEELMTKMNDGWRNWVPWAATYEFKPIAETKKEKKVEKASEEAGSEVRVVNGKKALFDRKTKRFIKYVAGKVGATEEEEKDNFADF